MIKRKVFISYKEEDKELKDLIIEKLENRDLIIDKHFHQDDWYIQGGHSDDEIMDFIKEKYISDSSVTLYLLTKNSKKQHPDLPDSAEHTKFMWMETVASLSQRGEMTTNGFILLMDSETFNEYIKDPAICWNCHAGPTIINPYIALKTIARNIFVEEKLYPNGHIHPDKMFVVPIDILNFIANPNKYIELAYERAHDENYTKYVYKGENE